MAGGGRCRTRPPPELQGAPQPQTGHGAALPCGPVELVLPAVLAVGGHGGGITAGLALGDLLERGAGVARARARAARRSGRRVVARVGRGLAGGGVGREPERGERGGPDDAVDVEVVAALEAADGRLRLAPEDAVGREAERALDGGDRHAAGRAAAARTGPADTRRGVLRDRAGGRERHRHGGDDEAGPAAEHPSAAPGERVAARRRGPRRPAPPQG